MPSDELNIPIVPSSHLELLQTLHLEWVVAQTWTKHWYSLVAFESQLVLLGLIPLGTTLIHQQNDSVQAHDTLEHCH